MSLSIKLNLLISAPIFAILTINLHYWLNLMGKIMIRQLCKHTLFLIFLSIISISNIDWTNSFSYEPIIVQIFNMICFWKGFMRKNEQKKVVASWPLIIFAIKLSHVSWWVKLSNRAVIVNLIILKLI